MTAKKNNADKINTFLYVQNININTNHLLK